MDARSAAHRERGNLALEAAIVLPILMVLVFGIITFGRAFQVKVELTGAVREGARARALDATDADTRSAVINAVSEINPPLAPADIDPGPVCPAGGGGDAVVTVEYALPYNIPFFKSGTFDFEVKGVMRCGL